MIPVFVTMIIINMTIGTIVALPTRASSIRHWVSHSVRRRNCAILLIASISFLVSFAAWTRLSVEIGDQFPNIPIASHWIGEIPEYQKNRSAVVNEVWIRRLIPLLLRQTCYTNQIEICDLADCFDSVSQLCPASSITNLEIERKRTDYLITVGICSVAALTGSLVAWRFTRSILARDTVI